MVNGSSALEDESILGFVVARGRVLFKGELLIHGVLCRNFFKFNFQFYSIIVFCFIVKLYDILFIIYKTPNTIFMILHSYDSLKNAC